DQRAACIFPHQRIVPPGRAVAAEPDGAHAFFNLPGSEVPHGEFRRGLYKNRPRKDDAEAETGSKEPSRNAGTGVSFRHRRRRDTPARTVTHYISAISYDGRN